MLIVHLRRLLRHPFHFYLEEGTRKLIVSRIKDYKNERINKQTIKDFLEGKTKHGLKFINHKTLIKLLRYSNLIPEDIEQSVRYVKRGWSNRELKVKLPINAGPELALLIAKTMVDGSILSDFRFSYTNSNYDLIKEVISYVNKAVGKTKPYIEFRKKKGNCYELKFPSVVGYILKLAGAPQSYKILTKFDVPMWIKFGNKEIKSKFIRGIFDDEACVNQSKKSRRIIFAMCKLKKYKNSLKKFLNSIRILLREFNINSSPINIQEFYKGRVMLRFTIYRKINFDNFIKEIKLSHLEKRNRLNKISKSYKDIHETKNTILDIIKNSQEFLKISKISKITGIKYDTIEYNLLNLYNEGSIDRTKIKNYWVWFAK